MRASSATEAEVMKHVELHGALAHGEDRRSGRRKTVNRSRSSLAVR